MQEHYNYTSFIHVMNLLVGAHSNTLQPRNLSSFSPVALSTSPVITDKAWMLSHMKDASALGRCVTGAADVHFALFIGLQKAFDFGKQEIAFFTIETYFLIICRHKYT